MESATAVKGADNVDIGCGNAFGGDDEAVDDSVEKVRLLLSTVVAVNAVCCLMRMTPSALFE